MVVKTWILYLFVCHWSNAIYYIFILQLSYNNDLVAQTNHCNFSLKKEKELIQELVRMVRMATSSLWDKNVVYSITLIIELLQNYKM